MEGCGVGWVNVCVVLAKGCGCAGRKQEAKEALLKGERPSLQSRGDRRVRHASKRNGNDSQRFKALCLEANAII